MIRNLYPEGFVTKSLTVLQDDDLLIQGVLGMLDQKLEHWLSYVQSFFGQAYYDQMISALYGSQGVPTWAYRIGEHHIYGSSRLGLRESSLLLATTTSIGGLYQYKYQEAMPNNADSVQYIRNIADSSILTFYRGQKRYELSNHLGNVLAVITDRRIQACGAGDVMYYNAQVVSVSDYYPFGSPMAERSWSAGSGYRFGFNGYERDDEVRGSGNSINFGERCIYDPRLGRFSSVDPAWRESASWSPYAFAANKPILCRDEGGEFPIIPLIKGAVGGVIDAGIQFAINLAVYDGDATKAWNNIDWEQAAISAGQSMLPWTPPGGKYGRAGFDAATDIAINYARGNYDGKSGDALAQAVMRDFLEGYIASAGASKLEDALPAIKKWLKKTEPSKTKPKAKMQNPPAEVQKAKPKEVQTSTAKKKRPVAVDISYKNKNSPIEDHHVTPKSLKDIEPIKEARAGGYKYDGKDAKIRTPKYNTDGSVFHAKHTNWTSQVSNHLLEVHKTDYWSGLTPEQKKDYVN